MMLALTTHEPNFCLLREEVLLKESKHSRKDIFQVSQFHFLSVTLLREYLAVEFRTLLKREVDVERVIDDFVFMCFLIGNDFLPNVPTVDISEGGIDTLFNTYAQVVPSLGGYLTEGGRLVLKNVEAFLGALGDAEVEPEFCFDSIGDVVEGLKGLAMAGDDDEDEDDDDESIEVDESVLPPPPTQAVIAARAAADPLLRLQFRNFCADGTAQQLVSPPNLDNEKRKEWHILAEEFYLVSKSEGDGADRHVVVKKKPSAKIGPVRIRETGNDNNARAAEERDWKDVYYKKRFHGRGRNDRELIDGITLSYLQGLAWVLHYYHHGCVSWGWYYPYHYAPLASDLRDLSRFEPTFDNFELGAPFHQYEQLLAVLPPSSRNALPAPFRGLMVSQDSPIIDYYPTDFELDLNGKRNDWEAVILIPFIEEKRLLQAVGTVDVSKLTEAERRRNMLGKTQLFHYDSKNLESHPSTLPDLFQDIREGHSTRVDFDMPTNVMENVLVLPPKVKLGADAVGLTPSFATLPHDFALKKIRVNVFGGRPSDKATQVAQLKRLDELLRPEEVSETAHLQWLGDRFLGRSCVIRWPHWQEARVVAAANRFGRADISTSGKAPLIRRWNGKESEGWVKDAAAIADVLLETKGLDCTEIDVLIYSVPLGGMRMLEDGATVKYYQRGEIAFPAQAIVFEHRRQPDPRFAEKPPRTLQELYPVGSPLICNNPADYGRLCYVVDHDVEGKRVVVQVEQRPPVPKFGGEVHNRTRLKYYSLYDSAKRLKISLDALKAVMGTVFVVDKHKKINVGLKLRFVKARQQIVGYSFGFEEKGAHMANRVEWDLSDAALDLISSYKAAFPEIFAYLAKTAGNKYDKAPSARPTEMFPNLVPSQSLAKAVAAEAFLKAHPYSRLPKMPLGAEAMPEKGIAAMDVESSKWAAKLNAAKPFPRLRASMLPRDLRRPIQELNAIDPNTPTDGTVLLGDRMMNLLDNGPIPFAAEGAVIGFTGTTLTILFDDEIASGTTFGGLVSGRKVASGLPSEGLMNLTRPQLVQVERNDWLQKSVDGVVHTSTGAAASADVPTRPIALSKSTPGTLERVKPVKPARSQTPVPDEPPYKAYVGNFIVGLTKADMEEFFAPAPLKDVAMKQGFCFITFESKALLEAALLKNGQELRGRKVVVNVAATKEKNKGKAESKAKGSESKPFLKPLNQPDATNKTDKADKAVSSARKSVLKHSADKPPAAETKPAEKKTESVVKILKKSDTAAGETRAASAPAAPESVAADGEEDFDPLNYFSSLVNKNKQQAQKDAKEAQPQAPKPQSASRHTLFLGNLPFSATEEQVREFVGDGIVAVNHMRKKGKAEVEMRDQETFDAALKRDASVMDGRKVSVEAARQKKKGDFRKQAKEVSELAFFL